MKELSYLKKRFHVPNRFNIQQFQMVHQHFNQFLMCLLLPLTIQLLGCHLSKFSIVFMEFQLSVLICNFSTTNRKIED